MLGWWLWVVSGCRQDLPSPCEEVAQPTVGSGPGGGGNVLVVLLDDLGVEQLGVYGVGPVTAPTPTIDCLCQRGIRFDRAWAAPLCSPGRSTLMTGRLSDRTGIGDNVLSGESFPEEEITIAEVLQGAGYRTGLVGKWHLDAWDGPLGIDAPRSHGFDVFSGTLDNLISSLAPEPEGEVGYQGYWWVDGGERAWTETYATTRAIDEALAFVADAPSPWFLLLSLHAPHDPFHRPPGDLFTEPLPDDPTNDQQLRAAIEAADTELGRLFEGMGPQILADTTVALVADNGTSDWATVPPFDPARVKRTIYEGGIHVPMVIAGPQVARPGVSDALVHLVDLLPTAAGIAGVEPPAELDGVDLGALLADPEAPGPSHVITEWTRWQTSPERAVRDQRYKHVRWADGSLGLFDLELDPGEDRDLMLGELSSEDQKALDRLAVAIDSPRTTPGR